MKKLFFIAIAVVVSVTSAIAENNWIGGGIGLGFESVINGESTVSFGLAPEFGHHFDNRFSLAGEMGYSMDHASDATLHQFYVGPYVRYDILNKENITLFGEFALHYQYADIEGYDANGVEMALRPGIALKMSDRWSLTGKFNLLEYGYLDKGDTHALGFKLTTGLTVGFVYNL